MKNLFVVLLITLCFLFIGTPAFSKTYKSFADLYPGNAMQETTLGNKFKNQAGIIKFHIIAEVSYYPTRKVWFQFIDKFPFEGAASIVNFIWICDSKHTHTKMITVFQALDVILMFCNNKGIDINEIMHEAPGIDKSKILNTPLPNV